MKALLVPGACALAFLMNGALAQQGPPIPPTSVGVQPQSPMPAPRPPEARSNPAGGDAPAPMHRGSGERGDRMHAMHGMHAVPPMGWGAPPPLSKAAHFKFEHGDSSIDVKCADDESMRACADVTIQLLDKLSKMPPGPSSPPPSSSR
ncbi:MAG: hypothetical protein ACLGHY_04735 [Gammaproteobacteria bacterium]